MGADPYGFIGRYQGLRFNRGEGAYLLATGLLELLADHARTKGRMIDPVIERFANSRSFDGTRAAWPALQALPPEAWTTERVARIREAAGDNSQISAASIEDAGEWWEAPTLPERHLRDVGIDDDDDGAGAAGDEEDEIPF